MSGPTFSSLNREHFEKEWTCAELRKALAPTLYWKEATLSPPLGVLALMPSDERCVSLAYRSALASI